MKLTKQQESDMINIALKGLDNMGEYLFDDERCIEYIMEVLIDRQCDILYKKKEK